MTDSSRYERVKEIFLEACEKPEEERTRFIREACGDDTELRREVELLLAEHDTATAASDAEADERRSSRAASSAASFVAQEEPSFETIGPYKVLHRLGRGGMGVVYLALLEDDRFQRRVAIKVVKKGLDTEDVLRRFELERQVLSALNHPGIARLYDAGTTEDGRPYFAMEYVEGQRIDDYCETKRLNVEERLSLFSKVCEAVHYAHQNLVVHRDLKPDNIVVTEDGQPKLLDFGIAKLLNPDLSLFADDYTAPDRRVMTPRYASPEQVRGAPITTASDVYSLGVLLYELLTGHAPYRLKSRIRREIERIICEVDPEKPSTAISRVDTVTGMEVGTPSGMAHTVSPESVSRTREGRPERLRRRLAGDIDNIVLMALRKEPQRRYRSAEQFAEDIRRHKEGQPVIARPPTVWYRSSKFVRRNRTGVIAASLVLVAIIAGLIGTSWQWRIAEHEREVAQTQRDIAQTEREKADRRFDQAWGLAKTFIYDFYDEIKMLEGAIEARELIVSSALDTLEELEQEVGENPALLSDIAEAYMHLGDIQGGARRGNIGETQAALASYRKSFSIAQELFKQDPQNGIALKTLFLGRMQVADLLKKTGDVEGALGLYEEALAFCRELLEGDPENWRLQRGVSAAMFEVGETLEQLGRTDEVMPHYREALAMREALMETNPNATLARRDLTIGHNRMSEALAAAGDLRGALDHQLEGLEIRRALHEEDPHNDRGRRDLHIQHYFIGETYLQLAEADSARQHLNEALAIALGRVEDSPKDARAREDLIRVQRALGDLEIAQNRPQEALVHYRAAQRQVDELVGDNPTNTANRLMQADSLAGIARVFAAQDNRRAAADELNAAIEIVRELADQDPSDTRPQERLAEWTAELERMIASGGGA